MNAPLREAIKTVLAGGDRTYRAITNAINREWLYVSKGGLLVAEAQV